MPAAVDQQRVVPARGERGRQAQVPASVIAEAVDDDECRRRRVDLVAFEMDSHAPVDRPLVLQPLELALEVEGRERAIAAARLQEQPGRDLEHPLRHPLGRRSIGVDEAAPVLGEHRERRLARAQRGLEAERRACRAQPPDPITGDGPVARDRRKPQRVRGVKHRPRRGGRHARDATARQPSEVLERDRVLGDQQERSRDVAKRRLDERVREIALMDELGSPAVVGNDRQRRPHQLERRVGEVGAVDEPGPQARDHRRAARVGGLPAIEHRLDLGLLAEVEVVRIALQRGLLIDHRQAVARRSVSGEARGYDEPAHTGRGRPREHVLGAVLVDRMRLVGVVARDQDEREMDHRLAAREEVAQAFGAHVAGLGPELGVLEPQRCAIDADQLARPLVVGQGAKDRGAEVAGGARDRDPHRRCLRLRFFARSRRAE